MGGLFQCSTFILPYIHSFYSLQKITMHENTLTASKTSQEGGNCFLKKFCLQQTKIIAFLPNVCPFYTMPEYACNTNTSTISTCYKRGGNKNLSKYMTCFAKHPSSTNNITGVKGGIFTNALCLAKCHSSTNTSPVENKGFRKEHCMQLATQMSLSKHQSPINTSVGAKRGDSKKYNAVRRAKSRPINFKITRVLFCFCLLSCMKI